MLCLDFQFIAINSILIKQPTLKILTLTLILCLSMYVAVSLSHCNAHKINWFTNCCACIKARQALQHMEASGIIFLPIHSAMIKFKLTNAFFIGMFN